MNAAWRESDYHVTLAHFFVEEHLLVVYENNFFESFNLYEIDGNPLYQHELDREKIITNKIENKTEKKVGEELEKNENCKIILCAMNNLEKKLIIIYEDHHVLIEDLSLIFSKMWRINFYNLFKLFFNLLLFE